MRAEDIIVGDEVFQEERRHEQRPEELLLILVFRRVARIGRDPGVLVVHRGKRLPMGKAIDEAAPADTDGANHEMRRHREVAEDTLALGHAFVVGADHVAEAPYRDLAPARLGRKEVPVRHHVAGDGVRDVVRGERERRDLQQHFSVVQLDFIGPGGAHEFAMAQVSALHQEVDCRRFLHLRCLDGPFVHPCARGCSIPSSSSL